MAKEEGKDLLGYVKYCLTITGLFLFSTSFGQQINKDWNEALKHDLQQFLACEQNTNQGSDPCNKFNGIALKEVYKVNDFYSTEKGWYMLVPEISSFLKGSGKWTLLGHAYEQSVLTKAQDNANSQKAVIAVYLNAENIGQVAIILPGALKPSGSWEYQVPNSSSFFMSDPEKSYVGKGLSYAFGRNLIKDVLIYSRNY